jgi:hypothetical protein
MKKISIALFLSVFFITPSANAQLLKRLGYEAKWKLEQKANEKIDADIAAAKPKTVISLIGKWRFTGSADDSNKNGQPDKNEIISGVNYYNKTIGKEKVEKLFDTYFQFTDNSHCNYITIGKVKFAYTYTVSSNIITLKHINGGNLEDEIFTIDDKTGYLLTISPLYREELGDIKSWEIFKKVN